MSDSEGYSDLWKFDDEDGNVVEVAATPNQNQNQSSASSKRKRVESENVFSLLCKRNNKKRRKQQKKFYGSCDDSEEDEILSQPKNEGKNRRFSMKGLQKASPIKISLLDDDDDDDCAEGNKVDDQKSTSKTKTSHIQSQQKSDRESDPMMKIREDLNEILQYNQQQEEADVNICDDEIGKVQTEDNAIQIIDDGVIQILEDNSKQQEVLQKELENQKEIYLQVDVECSNGKIPIKVYPSKNLSEAFDKFLEQAIERGWASKGKKFQFTYLGNKIDEWQTARDVGLRNKSSIQASMKEDVGQQITLSFKCQSGDVISFKHGPADQFEKLFQQYRETALSKKLINSKSKLVFQFDGENLEGNGKPQDFDMEDEDQIDVIFTT